MPMLTGDALIRALYEEYHRLNPHDRAYSHWVMDKATIDELDRLVAPPGDDPDDDRPRTTKPYLFGKPIHVEDGAEGFHLVAD